MSQFTEELMREDDPPKPYSARAAAESGEYDVNEVVQRPSREEVTNSLNTGVGNGPDGIGATANDRADKNSRGTSNDLKKAMVVVNSNLAKEHQPVNEQQVDPAMYANDGIGRIVEGSGADKENIQSIQIEPKPRVPAIAEQPVPPVGGQAVDASGRPVVDGNSLTKEQKAAAAAAATGQPATSATGAPAQPATAPVASTQATATADGQPVPEKKSLFLNWSTNGSFSSNNQTQRAISQLQELGYNPNVSTLREAVAQVEEYKRTGKPMPIDESDIFVKGWKAEDYNNLIDWNKVGLGGIDVSKPEDRKKIQDWLYMNFGEGLKSMHIDDKFGPFHIAAILEAAGQGGENTPGNPGNPEIPEPKRPEDPKEPEPDPYRDKYEYYVRQGLNPLLAYIGDEPKAVDTSRLRAIMGAQALGEGLRSIADIVHGPNGAPITKHENNVTDWSIGKVDEALKQFHSDKKEHRKMKLDALMVAMNNARSQSNMDRQDWRQSVAQMYDRFDKKVDRQDRQWKDLITRYDDRTDKNRDFRFKVDELAAKLEDGRLTRRQAKELAIMNIASQEKMHGNTITAQKEMNAANIEAGKYDNSSTDGGKNSTVTFFYKNEKGEDVEADVAVPENITAKVNLAIATKQQGDPAFRNEIYNLRKGLEKAGVLEKNINRTILERYIGNYYKYDGKSWVPIGQGEPPAAGPSLIQAVDNNWPAKTPSLL